MVWKKGESSDGVESHKIRWDIVPYTRGRVLDVGCGPFKTFPHFIGVDNQHHQQYWNQSFKPDIVANGDRLDLIASQSCDAVFSSHLLEHFEYSKVPDVLQEWSRVIKPGGHLILYVPDEDEYPKVGEEGANPDHKWNVNYDKVVAAMETVNRNWDLIEFQKRNGENEYSLYFVFKVT